MKILILNGHDNYGNGGAESKKYGNEQTLTRDFSKYLKIALDRVGHNTTIYNPTIKDKSAYTSLISGNRINFKDYDYIVELHFNAKGYNVKDNKQTGTEILIHKNATNEDFANTILTNLSKNGLKSRGVKRRSDLYVMNTAMKYGVPYLLWEICFIDDNDDMEFYSIRRQLLSKSFAEKFK